MLYGVMVTSGGSVLSHGLAGFGFLFIHKG